MIFGISGKQGSGKDLVTEIIQKVVLTNNGETYENKKFANKLKDIVCILLGCTREQLEDREFKEKELSNKWNRYIVKEHWINDNLIDTVTETVHASIGDANEYYDFMGLNDNVATACEEVVTMTPRLLLQLLGTEAGRNIIHPDIWVNSLFSEYIENIGLIYGVELDETGLRILKTPTRISKGFPNWIISDMRFKNEFKRVTELGGLTIRVNRYCYDSLEDFLVTYPDEEISRKAVEIVEVCGRGELYSLDSMLRTIPQSSEFKKYQHSSETNLDDTKHNYTIYNNGSIEELIEKVREILIKENII